MATIASLEVAITANTSAVERGLAQTNAALNQLIAHSGAANTSVTKMASGFAIGTVAAHAFMGAVQGVVGAMASVGKNAIDMASRLEQAKIGFTTMLGSAQAADKFIRDLQQFAEGTAFNFPGVQRVAQTFLAMGIEAKNVIPIVTDVTNALAAAGRGGDTEALVRVGASLSEIAAQGKVTAEQLRELARNGIAVMPMLADAMGITTAEVRKLAEEGKISATEFFEAFHSQVAQRYGNIQAEQAKTWAVAISNVQDILSRMTTETLADFFSALTQGALLLQDFLRSEQARQWAADMKASIAEVMAALAPLGAALRAAMGLPEQAAAAPKPAIPPPPPVPKPAIDAAKDYSKQIEAASDNIRAIDAQLTGITAKQTALKYAIEDTNKAYEANLRSLKDDQENLNAQIEATKTHYESILEPLERQHQALGRMADDIKIKFARIAEPFKVALEMTQRKIEDVKTGYEAMTRPIQAQIMAIEKANTALSKQRALESQIADIKLRQRVLAAAGDPQAQGEIARQLKLNEFKQDDINRQIDLLQLTDKKGNNEKKIERLQREANGIKVEAIKLEQRSADLMNRSETARITKDKIILDAAKEKRDLAQAEADIKANAAKAPLEDQLAKLERDFKRVTDPLEAASRALTRQIEDTARAEAAALKPIIDQQADLARQIQDVNQAQKDALAPLEAIQKGLTAEVIATEKAQREALAPLKDQTTEYERQRDVLEQQKKEIQDKITGWKNETAAIKERNAEAAKIAKPLDLTGGKPDAATAIPTRDDWAKPLPKSMIPPGLIDDFKTLAKNVQATADAFNNLNIATSGGLVGNLGELAKIIAAYAVSSVIVGGLLRLGPAIVGLAGPAGVATLALTGLLLFIEKLPWMQTQMGNWWDQFDKRNQEERDKDKADWDAHYAARKLAFDTFWGSLIPNLGQWVIKLKAEQDARLKELGDGWNGFWKQQWADWNRDWAVLKDAPGKAWTAFIDWLKPEIEKAAKLFDPIVKAIESIGEAISKLPSNLPGWMTGGFGGGRTSFGFTGGAGRAGDPVPGEIEQYIRQAAGRVGIDPDTAVRVALSEGGLHDPVRQSDVINSAGEREQSFGPFQLYINGGVGNRAMAAGIDPRDPAAWKQAIDFALAVAAKESWSQWHGAARVGIGDWEGIGGMSPEGIHNYILDLTTLTQIQPQVFKSAVAIGESIPAGMASGVQAGTGAFVDSVDNMIRRAENALERGDLFAWEKAFNVTLPPLQVPGFARGGVMHGDGLAYLHDGETVTPRSSGLSRGGSGGDTIILNMPNYVGSKEEMVAVFRNELSRTARKVGGQDRLFQ